MWGGTMLKQRRPQTLTWQQMEGWDVERLCFLARAFIDAGLTEQRRLTCLCWSPESLHPHLPMFLILPLIFMIEDVFRRMLETNMETLMETFIRTSLPGLQ